MGVIGVFDQHDPLDRLDYTIRWATWLEGDQITGSSYLADSTNPAGQFLTQDTFTTGTTTAWIASGTIDSTYKYDNTIGTSLGRTKNESILITVRDR